jgi:hypothetical protein
MQTNVIMSFGSSLSAATAWGIHDLIYLSVLQCDLCLLKVHSFVWCEQIIICSNVTFEPQDKPGERFYLHLFQVFSLAASQCTSIVEHKKFDCLSSGTNNVLHIWQDYFIRDKGSG